jgi:hypothetical protein
MPSASSPVKEALESYIAGRVKAERLVVAVTAEYYRDAGNGKREELRPLIDVIDRASPGIVELGMVQGGSGFDVRLAERPFPKQYEAQLREAAETVLSGSGMRDAGWEHDSEATHPASRIPHLASRVSHLVSWIRRLFGSRSA